MEEGGGRGKRWIYIFNRPELIDPPSDGCGMRSNLVPKTCFSFTSKKGLNNFPLIKLSFCFCLDKLIVVCHPAIIHDDRHHRCLTDSKMIKKKYTSKSI